MHNSMVEYKFDYLEEIDKNTLEQFKLYTIDKNFKVYKEQINLKYGWVYNIFSVYLIFKNEIITKKIGNYNFDESRRRKVYGYSDENSDMGIFEFNDKKLKIALSYKIKYSINHYCSIFDNQKRKEFMSILQNNKSKLTSNNFQEVNRSISNIISQQINISEENSINNLNIINEKTSNIK